MKTIKLTSNFRGRRETFLIPVTNIALIAPIKETEDGNINRIYFQNGEVSYLNIAETIDKISNLLN